MKVGDCRPPVATQACRGWGLIEMNGIHVDKSYCRTQVQKLARGSRWSLIFFGWGVWEGSSSWRETRRGRVYVHKGWQAIHCNLLTANPTLFPPLQRPPIADLQSFLSHQCERPGTASSRWDLVFDQHHMQLDSHCAPPRLETLSGWLFPTISPFDIQSSPVSFLTLCRHRVSPQQLAG